MMGKDFRRFLSGSSLLFWCGRRGRGCSFYSWDEDTHGLGIVDHQREVFRRDGEGEFGMQVVMEPLGAAKLRGKFHGEIGSTNEDANGFLFESLKGHMTIVFFKLIGTIWNIITRRGYRKTRRSIEVCQHLRHPIRIRRLLSHYPEHNQ